MKKFLFNIIIIIQILVLNTFAQEIDIENKNTQSTDGKANFVRMNDDFPTRVLNHGIAEYSPTGVYSLFDLQTFGVMQGIWQDPLNPANVHAVYNACPTSSLKDGACVYLFSNDFGQTWNLTAYVAEGFNSVWPVITGFTDGRAVISANTNSNGTNFRSKLFVDSLPGMGHFKELDPIVDGKSWPRLTTFGNDKIIFVTSANSSVAWTNSVTDLNPPGTFSGYVLYGGEHGGNYSISTSASGKVGHLYYGLPNTSYVLRYRTSSDFGLTWTLPIYFFSLNNLNDGLSRGSMSMIFSNETPIAAFTSCKVLANLVSDLTKPSLLRVWNPDINGGIPVIAADSTVVPFFRSKIQDYYRHLSFPSIGKSSDGKILVMTFHNNSGIYASTPDSSSYYDLWIAISTDNGATWINHEKITPDTPRRDWRFASVSPTNYLNGNQLTVQIMCQSDSVPGLNGLGIAPPGQSELVGIRYTTDVSVGIRPISNHTPDDFSLEQNYPNPFNPSTKIRYQIKDKGFVRMQIYNSLGKEIETLVNQIQNPGTYEINYDARDLPSGVYYYKLTTGTDGSTPNYTETKKMIVLK